MDEYEAIAQVSAFGEELRAHRQRVDWRLIDLAPKLCLSSAMVGAIERGTRAATHGTAELCDEVFNTPGTFVRLWRQAARTAVPSQVTTYYDLEAQATRIHKWELRVMPGLLQTEAYARAIMHTGWPRETDELIEDDVRARIGRQQVLVNDKPPLAWFVIDEALLYRPYGDLRAQVKRLISVATLPNVVIQVMPFMAVEHPDHRGTYYDSRIRGLPASGICRRLGKR